MLDVVEVPRPTPGSGQVLVQVRAAGINPGESKIRSGALAERWPANFPEGEGSDLAGVVTAVGPDVTEFQAGDEVLGYTNERASHAEFALVQAGEMVPKPAGLDWERAGALFVVGTSAYALVQAAGVGPEDVVLVSAAAGGVGSLAVQWARRAGATVVALAGPARHPWLREHGVVPVDYRGPNLAARITAALDGRPLTAVLDAYGREYVQLGLDLGVTPARIATIADFEAGELGATVVQHFRAATPAVLTELAAALASGEVEMPIAATYPLEQVREAYRDLENGHTFGKIVLIP